MAIINSYQRDTDIKDSDVFIGTKIINRQTVNFTAQTVANYLNVNGKVSIGGQMLWKFVVINPVQGTMSLPLLGGDNTPFANITELIVGKTDNSGQNVTIFLDYLINSNILLSQQSTANNFGHYRIVSYVVTSNVNFYKLTLEFIGGNGNVMKDLYYDMTSFTLSTGSGGPQDLQQVTTIGATTTNNIKLLGSYLAVNSLDDETGSVTIATDENNLPFIQLGKTANENTATIKADNIDTNSTYQLPNASGTIALTSDIPTPITNYIPLTGTTVGNPVNGDIFLFSNVKIKSTDGLNGVGAFYFDEDNPKIEIYDESTGWTGQVVITNEALTYSSNNPSATGFRGIQDFSSNITDLDYPQKIYVDTKEATINKQNSLTVDGTGVKYPTVDAVNAGIAVSGSKWTLTGSDIQNNNIGNVQVKLQTTKQFQILNAAGTALSYFNDAGTLHIYNGVANQYSDLSALNLSMNRLQASFNFALGNPQITQPFSYASTNYFGNSYVAGSNEVSGVAVAEHSFNIGNSIGDGITSGIFRISRTRLQSTVPVKYAADLSTSYDARTLIDKGYADATYASTAGFVPYTGATGNVNLGVWGLTNDYTQFNTINTQTSAVGKLKWNDTDGTLDLGLKGGNVTLQIGQETVIRVVNKTATNITLLESNYQMVRITGAQGQRTKVDLALADNDVNSGTTIGMVTETILNNQEGFINTSGIVRGINTTGSLQGETWADGDVIYLSGTVAGRVTNIKPVAPIHIITVGYVIYAHGINGTIFVKVDNGYELEELHNVSAIAPNNNEVLTYDTATLLWKPKTIGTTLGYTPANNASVVHLTGNETITGIKTFSNGITSNSLGANSDILTLIAGGTSMTIDDTSSTFTLSGDLVADNIIRSGDTDANILLAGGGVTALNALATESWAIATFGSGIATITNYTIQTSEPTSPSVGSLKLYAKKIGGKSVLKTKDSDGVDFSLQNSFWDNNVTIWNNTNATAGLWSGTVGAGAGAFTQALPNTTSLYTSIKRARYANVVTTTNQVLGQRNTEAMFFRGPIAPQGGFFFYARFGMDIWTNGSRLFAGMHSGTAVVSAEPSALNNTVGFCIDSGDNGVISFLTRGTAAPTKASTGYTITTGRGYDVYIYCAPSSSEITWKIEDLNAGTEASGTATLTLPTNTTMLTAGVLASNGALTPVTSVQLGINKIYIETDF
jgi:hypothetical protein